MKRRRIAGATAIAALLVVHPASAAESWTAEAFLAQPHDAVLQSIAAADGVAWAFGISDVPREPVFRTLAFRRGEHGWEQVPAPAIGWPNAAAVISRNDAWVVGDGTSMHWNGSEWREVPIVAHPEYRTSLSGVTAFGAGEVWSTGFGWHSDNMRTRSLVQRDVHALAPDDVWAVGYQHPGSAVDRRPVAVHWDGTRWSLAPVPDELGQLNDVVQVEDEVWAAGYASDRSPHVLRYDGTGWQNVPDPAPAEGKYLNTFAGTALDGRLLVVGVEADLVEPTKTRPYAATYGG